VHLFHVGVSCHHCLVGCGRPPGGFAVGLR
jgi:hypothetical protein